MPSVKLPTLVNDIIVKKVTCGESHTLAIDLNGFAYGWGLADQWQLLGQVYYFLLTLFNMIEGTKENSPIIDAKGQSQGTLTYALGFELYDTDEKTKLNALDYDNLGELKGKKIRVIVDIKRASGLPDKYKFKTKCKYVWNERQYETEEVEKTADPSFNYTGSHMQTITEEFLNELQYNTLTVSVYGMIQR